MAYIQFTVFKVLSFVTNDYKLKSKAEIRNCLQDAYSLNRDVSPFFLAFRSLILDVANYFTHVLMIMK